MKLLDSIHIIGSLTNTAVITPGDTFFGQTTDGFSARLSNVQVDQEFGLYDEIINLQRILSLFEEPEISIRDARIHIEKDNTKAAFLTSDISLIKGNSHDIQGQIEKTEQAPNVMTLELNEALMEKIIKAIQTIDNASIIIASKDSKVSVIIKDTDMLASDSNSLTISLEAEVSKDFSIKLDSRLLKRLPRNKADLKVLYNSRLDDYRILIHQEIKDSALTIVLPAEKHED